MESKPSDRAAATDHPSHAAQISKRLNAHLAAATCRGLPRLLPPPQPLRPPAWHRASKPNSANFPGQTAPSPWPSPEAGTPGESRQRFVNQLKRRHQLYGPVPAPGDRRPRSHQPHPCVPSGWPMKHAPSALAIPAWGAQRGSASAPVVVDFLQPQTSPKRCMWGTCAPRSSATRWRGVAGVPRAKCRLLRLNHVGDWGTQFGMLNHPCLNAGGPPEALSTGRCGGSG